MANIREFQFPPKTVPIGADQLYIADSAAAFGERNTTFDNVIANAFQTATGGANIATTSVGNVAIGTISASGISILGQQTQAANYIQVGQDSAVTITEIAGTVNIANRNATNSVNIGTAGARTIGLGFAGASVGVSSTLNIAGGAVSIATSNNGSIGIANTGAGTYTFNLGTANTTSNILGVTNINNTGTANTNINGGGGTLSIGAANSFVGNGGNVSLLNTVGAGGNFTVLTTALGTNSMTFGSEAGPTTFNTSGTININTSGSSAINVGTGSYTGTQTLGGNTINIRANSTGNLNIGNALNTIYIGSQAALNSIVNIQPNTGSGATNIGATAGYTGTITIGNASSTTSLLGGLSATKITLTNTTNQIILGTTNTTTLSATAPAASRTYTIPDVLQSGVVAISSVSIAQDATNLVLSGKATTLTSGTNCTILGKGSDVSASGAIERIAIGQGITVNNNHQCVIGSALLSVVSGNTGNTSLGQIVNPWQSLVLGSGSTNNTTIIPASQAAARSLTIPDIGGAANFLLSATNTKGVVAIATQKFTANGTYTPTAGMIFCIVECVGGGGGGGGATSAGGNSGAGGGGGAGGYARSLLTAATIGASKAVAIGVAGAAGAAGNNPGGNGGDTTLGSTIVVATGGTGGNGDPGQTPGVGGPGGGSNTGDVTFIGGSGGYGLSQPSVAIFSASSRGGSGTFGQGAPQISFNGSITGVAGLGFGSGGGGGMSWNGAGTPARAGGAGTAGIMVITEYIAT